MMYALTIEGDDVRLNGAIVTREDFRSKGLRGKTAYYPAGQDVKKLEALMDSEDDAWQGRQNGTPSYTFRAHKDGFFHVMPATVWGSESTDPGTALKEVWDMKTATAELGCGAGRTLPSTAGRLTRSLQGKKLWSLAPQWRSLAHAAIHQGPTVCLRGGASDAIHIDRVGAFLQGMRRPVPVAWVAWPGCDWAEVGPEEHGIARAVVWIDPEDWAGRLPPLPVKTSGGTLYPTGIVTGVWTFDLLRQAEAMGAVVQEIEECQLATKLEKIHEAAADRIEAIEDKRLRKGLYLRAWGRWAGTGGWQGTTDKRGEEDLRFGQSRLYWRWTGVTVGGHAAQDYRPDWAAFVSTSNQIEMNREIAKLGPDQLVAAHVDALWIDTRGEGYSLPSGWRAERRGPVRWYRVGTYSHLNVHKAQGCPWDIKGEADMLRWVGTEPRASDTWIRRWSPLGGPAWKDPHATSDPPVHTWEMRQHRPHQIPSCCDLEAWSGGWPVEKWKHLEKMSVLEAF